MEDISINLNNNALICIERFEKIESVPTVDRDAMLSIIIDEIIKTKKLDLVINKLIYTDQLFENVKLDILETKYLYSIFRVIVSNIILSLTDKMNLLNYSYDRMENNVITLRRNS